MYNEIEEHDGYFISYNPRCFDTLEAETAIVVDDATKLNGRAYYILRGDHRKAYHDKPLTDCLSYFQKHQRQRGWSSDTLKTSLNKN